MDAADVQFGIMPGSPVILPMVMTERPQPDFPKCGDCVGEMRICQDAPGEERSILCPKSLLRQRRPDLPWTRVRSGLAKVCDGKGSAATAAEAEKQEPPPDEV
jgi:hypothetical protein